MAINSRLHGMCPFLDKDVLNCLSLHKSIIFYMTIIDGGIDSVFFYVF